MTPDLAGVAAELERHYGLDPAAVGERLLRRAVEARRTVAPEAYRAALTAAERAELAEEVVVAETWVLRYPESFRHLAAWSAGRPVRVLCAPCSTGEEAFSAALTLLDAGRPAGGFEVVGADVSRRAVAAADRGVCGLGAFRDDGGRAARTRHFDPVPGGWAVRPAVRRAVRFRAGNLLAADFLRDDGVFDAVFCRNLFIYLTPAARAAATATLLRLLAPGGVLYMGHAEPIGLTDRRFRMLQPAAAFAYARAAEPAPPPVEQAPSPPKAQGRPSLGCPPPHAPTPDDPLAAARSAADRGDPAAAGMLEAHLRTAPDSADAHALLGVVRATAGDPAAADAALTRALFLDPTHADALLHRLLLAEGRGDAAAAAQFRRRLARGAGP